MNYNLVSPDDEHTRNGLSVFYIHPKPISKDFYSPVTLIYKGETYEIEGKIRGAQTALYPKKSYTLKFSDDKLFSDADLHTNFVDKKKIALLSNFDDNSHIRNRLAYFMWNLMDNGFKINTASSEVYTNGSYEGLYTVVDFIDEVFIERNFDDGNGIATGGELFKGVRNGVDFRIKSDLLSGFEKKLGEPVAGDEGAYDTLRDFIGTINSVPEGEFVTEFDKIADEQSYYDWWFFICFMKAWDSRGKNSYHYKDPSTGKLHYIPWDFNESFGQSWNTKRLAAGFDPATSINGISDRLIDHPDIKTAYDTRYDGLLDNELALSEFTAEIDRLYAEVETAAKADYSKWGSTYRGFRVWDDRNDYTTVDEEFQYIKDWITTQHTLFTAEF